MNNIWWNKVPNARILVDDIVRKLREEKSIIFTYNKSLPWRYTFVQQIKEKIRLHSATKGFENIDDISDPGKYLLDEYCKSAKRALYRPSMGYAKFFAESDDIVLHENYFWITVKSEEQLKKWSEFVSDYYKERTGKKSKGIFFIESAIHGTHYRRKGLEVVDANNYINEYDLNVFATLLVSELYEPAYLKSYLVELASNIVAGDAELLALIIGKYREFIANPIDTVNELIASNIHSDGSDILFDDKNESMEQMIWKAQIRTIYPKVEEFRRAFVERFEDDIRISLPIETYGGEMIYSAKAVELGTLVYLAGTKKLIIPASDYNKLELYKNARNTLSHLGILSWKEIAQLFD